MVKTQKGERERLSESVLRCIRETPGLSARSIAGRLGLPGDGADRLVRTCIKRLRERGANLVAPGGAGYFDLDAVEDAEVRADMVRAYRTRTGKYLRDYAGLLKQISGMTTMAIAQQVLFDLTVPTAAEDTARPVSMADLAKLPPPRRAGLLKVLGKLLEGIAEDPVAFAVERAFLADRYGRVFLTKADADKVAQAKRLLEEVPVG